MNQQRTQSGRLSLALVAALLVVSARPALAQWGLWPADSLLAEGRLAAAESVYYAASRQRPRDPQVRAALGRFLAARGGVRAGAVLVEEARFFGGDSAALARVLAPLYERLGDYRTLFELQPNVLTPAERRRARWLAGRPLEARLRDTVVLMSYRPIGDGSGLGTVTLRVGRVELPAVVDPRIPGLVLPSTMIRDLRTFGTEGGRTVAVADSVRIGTVMFTNVPTTMGTPDEQVRVGFDVIAPYFPGFDPSKGILTLRRVGRRGKVITGSRVPTLYDADGLRLLIGGKWQSSSATMPAMLLATRRWMWDNRLADVVLY